MIRFHLIRHGSTRAVGRVLAGRAPGVPLDADGARQAMWLARRLSGVGLAAVYSSPIERAVQTAAPLAERLGVEVQVRAGVTEVDCGEWTGRAFDELAPLPRWRRYNQARSCTRIPGGEHMLEVQARAVAELERIEGERAGEAVAVVSHADVIRAALAHYAGVPMDLCLRLEISPGSITVVTLHRGEPRVLCVNHTEQLPS